MPLNEKACEDGRTVTETRGGSEFVECCHCGRSVRWDLVDHPFFGFQHCPEKSKPSDERVAAR